jgi:putative ATPase
MAQALAFALRPTKIDEIIGQSHLLDQNGIIRKIEETKFCPNLIFYGPPGIGKTSMANAVALSLGKEVLRFNASNDKKEKLQKFVESANSSNPPVIIIDEIHRMNKNIQDYLLEYAEERKVIIFCTTTENPFFTINPAIRSRATILQLQDITTQEMYDGLKRIFTNHFIDIDIDDDVFRYICQMANGDLRTALNVFEIILNLYANQKITFEIVAKIMDRPVARSFKDGDEFHDLKSALQKSIRGSDVDASLHYWARLVELGDFESLMRRMVLIAYEDIGLANPAIPQRVATACEQFRKVGMPEGRIILGLAVIEMALSEKSNSAYLATEAALNDVREGIAPAIPKFLKDTHYASASELGSGIGYKYAHDYPNDYVDQIYLPKELKNVTYYHPKKHSVYENKLIEIYNKFTKKNK